MSGTLILKYHALFIWLTSSHVSSYQSPILSLLVIVSDDMPRAVTERSYTASCRIVLLSLSDKAGA